MRHTDLSFDMVLETLYTLVNTATSRKTKTPIFLTAFRGDITSLNVLSAQGSAQVRAATALVQRWNQALVRSISADIIAVISSILNLPSFLWVSHYRRSA